MKTFANGESGYFSKKSSPRSLHSAMCGSKGNEPNSRRDISSHIPFAPPVVSGKIGDTFAQHGQTNELMFSNTPRMATFVFRQKLA